MEVETTRHLIEEDIELASQILVNTFKMDKGIYNLFDVHSSSLLNKMKFWFKATLKLQIESAQPSIGLFRNNNLIGLALLTKPQKVPTLLNLIQWTLYVLKTCGFKTVLKTVSHENFRKKFYKDKNQIILEFICLDKEYQGQGLVKLLFNKIDELSKNSIVWLETTKEVNIYIFQNFGFIKTDTVEHKGITYFIMIKNKMI